MQYAWFLVSTCPKCSAPIWAKYRDDGAIPDTVRTCSCQDRSEMLFRMLAAPFRWIAAKIGSIRSSTVPARTAR